MNFPQTTLETIDKLYRPTLQNINVPHPKIMILFSGAPSSGKSTVAKAVERRFKTVRMENDAIRTIATELFPKLSLQQKSELSYAYMDYLWSELVNTSKNGLWVIDSSVDRRYQHIINFARHSGFQTILFAMKIPERMHGEWITNAGDRPYASAQLYLTNMTAARLDQARFLEHNTPDMVLSPEYSLDEVFDLVESRLNTLH